MLDKLRRLTGTRKGDSGAHVEIYTWRTCPFCLRAKLLLWRKGVAYTEYRVGRDDEARHRMAERANGHWTVPEVFIDGVHIGGCEELLALARDGRLDDLLWPAASAS